MAANHLLGCPTCGCLIFLHEPDWPEDRVACPNCGWQGVTTDLAPPPKPKRRRVPPA